MKKSLRRGSAPLAIGLPSQVRVGSNCGSKYTCTSAKPYYLEPYVEQGLEQEWIPSWDMNSLMAGAVAYRTYGAYYVANPLCPALGVNGCTVVYDICDTTACQAFTPTRKPAPSTSAAAAGTSGVVLVSEDGLTHNQTLIKAEYSEENNLASSDYATCGDGYVGEPGNPTDPWPCMKDFLCAGTSQAHTHSRGMCQYGSQYWATGKNASGAAVTKKMDWRCILDHYYNDNANRTGAGGGLRTAIITDPAGAGPIPIAVAANNHSYLSIYSINADGSGLRQLTSRNQDMNPSWSPNGDKIVFASSRGTGELYVVGSDGTGMTPIPRPPNIDWEMWPSWSSGGNRQIAFRGSVPQSNVWQIYIMGEDGSNPLMITPLLTIITTQDPAWSPDGTRVAFAGVTWCAPVTQIYVIGAYGGGLTQLTWSPDNSYIHNIEPTWSPDGTQIAFSSDRDGPHQIYVMNSGDGSNQTCLTCGAPTPVWNRHPSWSADGRAIAFASTRNDPTGSAYQVFLMNPDGTNQTPVNTTLTSTELDPDCRLCARFDIPLP